MKQSDHDLPEEFGGIVEQLRAHLAELSPLDLDRIKRTSRDRAVGQPRLRIKREERIVMKTRASILAVLASGIVLSGGGAAMGISGLANDGSASQAQYLTSVTPKHQGAAQVLGAHANVKGQAVKTRGAHATRPAAAVSPSAVAQPTRQQSLSRGGSLPFTGYAAIPVLLMGLGLLGTGLVMRRRTNARDEL
jgi:hypothetical protein